MQGRLYRLGISFLAGLLLCFMLDISSVLQSSTQAKQIHSLEEAHLVASSQGPTKSSDDSRSSFSKTQDQGLTQYKAGQYTKAIALWLQALALSSDEKSKATIHANLGSAYQQVGKLNQAIEQWEQAIQIYREKEDGSSRRLLAELLTDQAQAYNSLGQFRWAISLLKTAINIAHQDQVHKTETVAQGALGNAYATAGDYEQALKAYSSSLKLAITLRSPDDIIAALNNQANILSIRSVRYLTQASSAFREGNTQEQERLSELAEQDRSAALAAATRAVRESKATGGMPEVRALLNVIRLSPSLKQDYQKQAIAILEKLPDSRSKAYALVQLSNTEDQATKGKEGRSPQLTIKNLSRAISVAKNIGDSRTESFALGALGHVYELKGQFTKAIDLTRQAQFAAQQVNAGDSLYHWQWQAGRIYRATSQTESAISSYKQAIATLQSIRGDIVTANQDLQFDVRDEVEPVYRELMALLLHNSQNKPGNVSEALQVSELLKLSELQSFFGDDCVEVAQAISSPHSDLADTNSAVINSIILGRETYMILRLPDGELSRYPVPITTKQLQSRIERFRFLLEDIATDEYLVESQNIYDLLLRPMEADLARAKPTTLVFINDGVLRNVPMAALHDGKQFLVEKYPIATTLGLDLTSRNKPQQSGKALIFGLTVEMPPFPALPSVSAETEIVQDIVGGKRFLDKDFTQSNLEKQVQKKEDYPIVHLATHGEFRGTAESTFLQAFDGRISLAEFEQVLRNNKEPIELLTLSACQTAAGDNRSTLGIAGLAVRTGVSSVLASLWFVNDADIVPLIEDFYTQMRKPGMTKAEALRKAQLKLISDPNGHPAVWSSFVLIGNWL